MMYLTYLLTYVLTYLLIESTALREPWPPEVRKLISPYLPI